MAGGLGSYPEHHFRRAIPGDIESVRQRLCAVLEEFNYVVLSENPIQAKRDKTTIVLASTMLDCDANLTIALKSISPASTLATFNYTVPYLFTAGDMRALECEAEAMIALATASPNTAVCPSCETENSGAVRFCRACGKPVSLNKLPVELEVMRLQAGASSSQQEITMGLVVVLLNLITTLPLILSSVPKAVWVGWVLFVLGQLAGLFFLLMGMSRLYRTVKPAAPAQQGAAPDMPRGILTEERAALPPRPASVTEGTTELMNPTERHPVPIKLGKDTDSMQ